MDMFDDDTSTPASPEPEASASAPKKRRTGGPTYPLPRLIANERSHEPLLIDTLSARIRRRLLHGEVLAKEDITDGAPIALQQVVSTLYGYGFTFEKGKNGNGKTTYRMTNPGHEPVLIRKPTMHREGSRSKIREALLAGHRLDRIQSQERFGGGESALRVVVESMRKEGYNVVVDKKARPWTYELHAIGAGQEMVHVPAPTAKPVKASQPQQEAVSMLDLVAMPAIGHDLKVKMLSLDDDDGTVLVGLKNSTGMWLARIEGYVPSD